jgi:hypothetical protein
MSSTAILKCNHCGDSRWPLHSHPNAPSVLLTLPDRDRTAGFFLARMRRVGGDGGGRL